MALESPEPAALGVGPGCRLQVLPGGRGEGETFLRPYVFQKQIHVLNIKTIIWKDPALIYKKMGS